MKKYIIISIVLSVLTLTSCFNDLNVTPDTSKVVLSDDFNKNPEHVKQVLAKIYASFITSGKDYDGKINTASNNDDFFTTARALWNLQEITTDEAICAWSNVGIAGLNTQQWNSTNPFFTAVYQRLNLSIAYTNEFLRVTENYKGSKLDLTKYRAEVRFLRAFAYYWLMDLFGNPSFTTEKDEIGKSNPRQIKRAKLFKYIVDELTAIEKDLREPGSSYPQADKAACWMLLAKVYLNAEVYTGTAQWDKVEEYTNKVIECGAYQLARNYRKNFCADNDYYHNKEMIFALEQNGTYTQGYVGTTFIIESSSDSRYIPAEVYHGLTANTNWNANRARKDFVNIILDTLTHYNGEPVPAYDTIFCRCLDNRIFLRQKRSMSIPSASASSNYGVGVYKFTARNSNGTQAKDYNPAYASTDFPIFRLADAYLMRAEALHKLGRDEEAANDINIIRERAYRDSFHNITAGEVTDKFILEERAREFYYEAHRRTDLIRFGQFTNGNYHWQWKGGKINGVATSAHLNIFPIPENEIAVNPNLKQNPGY